MSSNLIQEFSYDGYDILKVKRDNKFLYLGSKYNMKKEIDIIHNKIQEISTLKEIIIFGSGNGVWTQNLDNITTGKRVLIIEPDKEVFDSFVKKNHNIVENTVSVICMEDKNFYNNLLSAIETSQCYVFVFSNYDFVYQKEYNVFIEKMNFALIDLRIMERTHDGFSKIWFENYLKNIPFILKSNDINNYKNLVKGKPAIIVSAGPSLDKNLKLLKGNEDKFIIISVGRALKALKKENIKADFTAIIDGAEEMYEVFQDSLESNVPLLFNEQAEKKIVEQYHGEKVFFATRQFINSDKEILQCNPIVLFQGGSVAHACIDFAQVLGCNPIILIGQDLAYTNEKMYSENSITEFEQSDMKVDTGFYVDGVKEDKVKTDYDLNIFRERIEMMVKSYKEITFVNATEGGARISGTIERDLKELIEKYTDPIDKTVLKQNYKIEVNKEVVLTRLKTIYSRIDILIKLCEEALNINKNLSDLYLVNINKYNKALDRLNNIDAKIKQEKDVNNLLETMINPINIKIVKKFSEKKNNNSIIGKIKENAQRGEFLCNELIKVFKYAKPVIKDCIDNLECE